MIAFLNGVVAEKNQGEIVLDVMGVAAAYGLMAVASLLVLAPVMQRRK